MVLIGTFKIKIFVIHFSVFGLSYATSSPKAEKEISLQYQNHY